MTKSQLKKLAKNSEVSAAIVSDGCRDYVVEIRTPQGAGLLKTWRGKTRRFASLREARNSVRHIPRVCLNVRIAADEACAPGVPGTSGFSEIPLTRHVA